MKLTAQTSGGRGVYSFCMCPGGFVCGCITQSRDGWQINGMSNHDRAGANLNSALIVTVTPEDFPQPGTLGGVTFSVSWRKRHTAAAAEKSGTALWRFPGKPEFNGIWSSDTTV